MSSTRRLLDRLFRLDERGTDPATEVRAGLVTFLTMSYILFVNPQILSTTGMPVADVTVATALAAAAGSLAMGLLANYPFALAPGMGLNAYFAFGIVAGLGVSWQMALGAVFIEGLIFLGLAVGGFRRALLRSIPDSLKQAITGGIGLFLALIGLQSAGLVVADSATLITLGDLSRPEPILALIGVVLIAVLLAAKRSGAILVGILAVTGAAWAIGLAPLPDRFFSLPQLPETTLGAFEIRTLVHPDMLAVIVALLFVDIFDTAGTLVGVGRLGGFLDRNNDLPRANAAFSADAIATTVGAALGTSSVTTYVESATGIEEGGRTGLTASVVAVLFLASLFFVPVLSVVPACATAPALIVVGSLMLKALGNFDFRAGDETLPAFLTLIGMPFTFSIANGISLGVVSFVTIKCARGRFREVPPLLAGVAVLLVVYYAHRALGGSG